MAADKRYALVTGSSRGFKGMGYTLLALPSLSAGRRANNLAYDLWGLHPDFKELQHLIKKTSTGGRQ